MLIVTIIDNEKKIKSLLHEDFPCQDMLIIQKSKRRCSQKVTAVLRRARGWGLAVV